jgi:membrane-associated phospholipid phosphatase
MRSKRFWKGAAIVSGEMLGAMALFTTTLAGIVYVILPSIRRHKKTDLRVFELVKAHTNERNTQMLSAITFLAKHQFLIPANLSLIGYFLFVRKRTWFSIRVAAIALSSLGLMFLLKYLFRRKRPREPLLRKVKGLSFPSGHAIHAVTFYGLLIYIIRHTQNNDFVKGSSVFSLVTLIFLIGYSRVYLRVHYASDVASGFIVGTSWLFVSLSLLKRIEEYNKRNNIATAVVKS